MSLPGNIRFDIENMAFYNVPTSAAIQGHEMTMEWRVICALVKRLGGRVELSPHEFHDANGVIGSNGYGGKMILEAD